MNHRIQSAAFTLVELLVVVAIIAILAALLLVSVSSAKKGSLSAHCRNNLRQWGISSVAYAGDHDDALPFAYTRTANADNNNFHPLLSSYLGKKKFEQATGYETGVARCPIRILEPVGPHNQYRISYGMNMYNSEKPEEWDTNTVSFGSVPNPSHTLLMSELSWKYNHPPFVDYYEYPPLMDQIGFRHQERALILFMDTHIESRRKSATNFVVKFH